MKRANASPSCARGRKGNFRFDEFPPCTRCGNCTNSLFKMAGRLSVFFFSLLILFFSGCEETIDPTEGDTVLGDPSRPAGEGGFSPDAIDPVPLDDDLTGRSKLAVSPDELSPENAFESIFFGFDEYFIRESERPKLERIAAELRAKGDMQLYAKGHTDWRGTEAYNLGLGDRRANAVKSYLAQIGINPTRINATSEGELLATPNVGKQDPAAIQDRRVDLFMVK